MNSYTEEEILGLYRRGKDDPHILEKLSDLACKPKGEVVSLLHRHGLMLDGKRPDEPSRPLHRRTAHTEDAWRKAIALRLAGESWSRIERETGIPADVARNGWRKWAGKLGVPLPEEAFKPKQTKPFTLNPERRIPVNLENTAAAPEAAPAEPVSAGPLPGGDEGFWARFLDAVTRVNMPLGYTRLLRGSAAEGELCGDTAYIRLSEGVLYNALSSGENLNKVRAAASAAAGREICVSVEMLSDGMKRSLDELRRFKDTVRFIGKDGN